jgi:eukaryotic-like serine/threonine-protein kinase
MADDTRSLRPARATAQPPQQQREGRELVPGERVGDWVIGARLGGGGFGAVHAARHAVTGAPCAIKVLHAHFTTSPEMLARFQREIDVLARLQHPNVVQTLDAGFADGRPYLCMELLGGRDLTALLQEQRALHVDLARRIFEPLCEAVGFAHEVGVVHRDLKASNVFVCDGTSRVVLLDFGIAKLSDALAPELTATHQSLGTPGCMAPEQIHGARIDARTDVYSLGALLFHMITGQQPFYDPSDTMMQYLHLHARRPRASALVPEATRLDELIIRAMAIEPNDRYQDARSLLAALRQAMRQSRHPDAVTNVDHAAILVAIEDLSAGRDFDETLLADLEGVLPAIERALSDRGFTLAVDLGSSALFITPEVDTAIEVAHDVWQQVERRPTRDPRVRVGMCVHRGSATLAGHRVQPCALLRPETWGMPELLDGLWLTHALAGTLRRLA